MKKVLATLDAVRDDFNDSGAATNGRKVSSADLIVLAGNAAVEAAAKAAGHDVAVPFAPGRTDAAQEQTDVVSFDHLKPVADGFRNYVEPTVKVPVEHLLIDKAQQFTLTAAEMTVLVGGLRVLDANEGQSPPASSLRARAGSRTTFS